MEDTIIISTEVQARVSKLSEEGCNLADQKDFDGALLKFNTALALLPPPVNVCNITFRIYTCIGDMYLGKGDLVQARANYMYALQLSGWEG
jgi:hypothetical protein